MQTYTAEELGLVAYHLAASMLDEFESMFPGSSKRIAHRVLDHMQPGKPAHDVVRRVVENLPAAKL